MRRLRVTPLRLRPSIPGVARRHSLKPLGCPSSLYLIPILQSSETAPGSRMALQPHPRSPVQQSRARGSPLTLAGHQPLGPDDDPSTNEGRGTPHETTEGLDQDTCWSDHSHHYHKVMTTGGLCRSPRRPCGSRGAWGAGALRCLSLLFSLSRASLMALPPGPFPPPHCAPLPTCLLSFFLSAASQGYLCVLVLARARGARRARLRPVPVRRVIQENQGPSMSLRAAEIRAVKR